MNGRLEKEILAESKMKNKLRGKPNDFQTFSFVFLISLSLKKNSAFNLLVFIFLKYTF